MSGFSDEERREVEERLVRTGRELFTRYGFQKTTIEDITDSVGIGEGTFYRFFEGKSSLYVRVLVREQDEVIDAVETELDGLVDPAEQLDGLLRTWVAEFEQRPLLLRSHRAPDRILRSVDGLEATELRGSVSERMTPLVANIQERSDGYITEIRPEAVFELLSLLEIVAANRDAHDELGWSGYDEFKEIVITVLKRGLLWEPGSVSGST
ncbi:MAG: TetR/AcrR family transcriptional regulator [Halosimplex sp.]